MKESIMRKLSLVLAFVLAATMIVAGQQATVLWDASPDADVAGYIVHLGQQPGVFTQSYDVGDTRQLGGITYGYVAVSAYRRAQDGSKVEGPKSPALLFGPAPAPTPTPTPQPTPTPTPVPQPTPTVSANGTVIPPATQIVDVSGSVWTLNATGGLLQNGVPVGGGIFQVLLWWNNTLYGRAGTSAWYVYLNGSWITAGTDPRGTTDPIPTPSPAPTPTPTPSPSTLTSSPKTCTVTDTKPDARTRWGVQFSRDGIAVGGRDADAPYSRDYPFTPGTHVMQAVWTKTGVAAVTRQITTQGC
jgi:hypothetical protein